MVLKGFFMTRLICVLTFFATLYGCSIEEHNRKSIIERGESISELQKTLESDLGSVITRESDSIKIFVPKDKMIFYFAPENHHANPSIIIHEDPEKAENSWWRWRSGAEKEDFNDWFFEFWKKRSSRTFQCSDYSFPWHPQGSVEGACFSYRTEIDRYYRDGYLDVSFDMYKRCRCWKDLSKKASKKEWHLLSINP